MTSAEPSEAKGPPQTPVLTIGCRMLRSPSHESVTTDLSLFSVSSIASGAAGAAHGIRGMRLVSFKMVGENQWGRAPSPNPECRALLESRQADIPELLWFEEENDLIRSCAALTAVLGPQKSFSTSDITQLPSPEEPPLNPPPRSSVSELALSSLQRSGYLIDHPRLEHASRTCSTWVAVGDIASTSQLPSPHGGHSAPAATSAAAAAVSMPPPFTAADLIRSVNKKVRQNYIRRRLLTTYKALERLSQSEFNLDRLEGPAAAAAATAAAAAASAAAPNTLGTLAASTGGPLSTSHLTVPGSTPVVAVSPPAGAMNAASVAAMRVVKQRATSNLPLTIRDVERERGKPLSKYERNMMIFNWLHTLDDTSFEV